MAPDGLRAEVTGPAVAVVVGLIIPLVVEPAVPAVPPEGLTSATPFDALSIPFNAGTAKVGSLPPLSKVTENKPTAALLPTIAFPKISFILIS